MSHRQGYIYSLVAAFSYSIVAIFGKHALSAGAAPESITFWQYTLTSVILLGYFGITDRSKLRISRSQFIRFAILGVFGSAVTNVFYYNALSHLTAGIASMLLFSAPFLINLFFIVTGWRRIRTSYFIPIGLGLFGNFLALNLLAEKELQLSSIGILYGFLAAVFFAFNSIFMDLKVRNQDANQMNLFSALCGMMATGAYLGVTNPSAIVVPTASMVWLGLTAIFSGIIPVYFAYHALQTIGSDKSSIISTIELPFTLIIAFLALGERLGMVQLIGMSFVIASIVLLRVLELKS